MKILREVIEAMRVGAFCGAVCLSFAGCPMSSTPAGVDPNAGGGGSDATAVSFAQQIQPIFVGRCDGCHSQGGFADNQGIALRLTASESLAGLVNQTSSQNASLTLVTPGDAANSLLFQKVSQDSPPIGSRMPLFGSPLSVSDQNLIRDWIDQGALDN